MEESLFLDRTKKNKSKKEKRKDKRAEWATNAEEETLKLTQEDEASNGEINYWARI